MSNGDDNMVESNLAQVIGAMTEEQKTAVLAELQAMSFTSATSASDETPLQQNETTLAQQKVDICDKYNGAESNPCTGPSGKIDCAVNYENYIYFFSGSLYRKYDNTPNAQQWAGVATNVVYGWDLRTELERSRHESDPDCVTEGCLHYTSEFS